MISLVMSDKYKEFCDEFKIKGYNVLPTDTISEFLFPEQKHADMQILTINNNIFLLEECTFLKQKLSEYNPIISSKKANGKYPDNVQMNFLYLNNTLYGKLSVMSDELKSYCMDNEIQLVNVNQGYCRCSTLIVDEKAVITADSSIEKVLKNNGVEVLKIEEGSVVIDGFDYGFIGGASAKAGDIIFFFGNITNHPDYIKIKNFIEKHYQKIEILCKNLPLTDIGGVTLIK